MRKPTFNIILEVIKNLIEKENINFKKTFFQEHCFRKLFTIDRHDGSSKSDLSLLSDKTLSVGPLLWVGVL